LTSDAQPVFLVLLAIARDAESAAMYAEVARAAAIRVDEDAAAILDGLADRVQHGGATPAMTGDGSLRAFERSIAAQVDAVGEEATHAGDRKSTRLNSSHGSISYAVFCLKKK